MKALTVLSLIQVIVLALLIHSVNNLQRTSRHPESTDYSQLLEKLVEEINTLSLAIDSGQPHITEESLRNIIKYELSQLHLYNQRIAEEPDTQPAYTPANDSSDDLHYEAVERRLDQYISSSTISGRDMEEIYSSLPQMNRHQRQAVMRRLAQSINSGKITLIR